jgi:hypothetical protein
MDRYEFYKELYNNEIERKNSIESSLNIPIVIITGLISTVFYIGTTFDYSLEKFLSISFVGLLVTSGLFTLIAVYYLIRAFNNLTSGFEYHYLPYGTDLEDYYERLKEFNDGDENKTNEDFKKYLTSKFNEQFDKNAFINDKKSGYIHQARRFIVFGLLSLTVTFVPFGYNLFNKEEQIQKIELIKKDRHHNRQERKLDKIDSLKIKGHEQRRETKDTTATTKGQGN